MTVFRAKLFVILTPYQVPRNTLFRAAPKPLYIKGFWRGRQSERVSIARHIYFWRNYRFWRGAIFLLIPRKSGKMSG